MTEGSSQGHWELSPRRLGPWSHKLAGARAREESAQDQTCFSWPQDPALPFLSSQVLNTGVLGSGHKHFCTRVKWATLGYMFGLASCFSRTAHSVLPADTLPRAR